MKNMQSLPGLRMVAVALIVAIATGRAAACKCASNIHGKNPWDTAKLETQEAAAVFEGTPEKFELQWSALNAKPGDLIPSDVLSVSSRVAPRMLVTLRVQRAYKGNLGSTVQVGTGLGGGDCATSLLPGLTYLIYAYGPTVGELRVSMCSPGGWTGDKSLAPYLRFLRKEHPIASDLTAPKSWSNDPVGWEPEMRVNSEEIKKQYAITTGKICGVVTREDTDGGIVSFFSTLGHSPVDFPTAHVDKDGSFCSMPLGPSKYYVQFVKVLETGPAAAAYYPGVSDPEKAVAIEIGAGQMRSDIDFKALKQTTHSVLGIVTTNDKSGLSGQGFFDTVSVVLVPVDANHLMLHTQEIDFSGNFPLPKIRFFKIENVIPGRYFAYASYFGKGWFTRKVEVNVTDHTKFISLELVHKK